VSQLPTVVDVGRLAGVSRQTVSNVLNSPEVVRPATRERVEAAIATLGYRPHASARRLRTKKSSTLGVRLGPVLDGISGSVLDHFLHALTQRAEARGMRIMVYTAKDAQEEIRQFERLFDAADVDGFVLTATFHHDPRPAWLIDHGIPFVTFGRPWGIDDLTHPRHPWVDVDGRSGVREATSYLLGLGSSRVAFLGWPSADGTGQDRELGWRDAMTEAADVSAAELDALVVSAEDRVRDARDAVEAFLATGAPFDAMVCASDSLALGALLAVGTRLPVIGFDNTPVAAAVGLSSVEQPLDEVAAGALDLLMGASGGEVLGRISSDAPQHRLVVPHLVIREQVRA
jgi:DNA-binding LacI/PurR family transcriptional regulator